MSRSAEDILDAWLRNYLPPGPGVARDPDSNVAGFLGAFSFVREQTEATIEAFRLEISPENATMLLDDYKKVLGTDACGRDQGDLSVAEWQKLLFSRWIATGGQSLDYYRTLAEQNGNTLTIEELDPTVCGPAVCGVDVCSQWSDIDVVVLTLAKEDAGLACQILNNIPAETTAVLIYADAA